MDLILWRHAEAEEPQPGQTDLDRPLTPRGERQATKMAAWLHRQLPEGVRILGSPAARAQGTAMKLERKFRTLAEIAPDASAETLLAAAGWPGGKRVVLLVGHQPALGRAAALAITGRAADWSMRKG